MAQAYRRAVDKLREQVHKRLKQQISAEAYAELKSVLTVFRKNNGDLHDDQRRQLRLFLDCDPELKLAYTLREKLTALFEMRLSWAEALKRLDAWQAKVRRSGLTCFNAFLKTIKRR